MSMEPHLAPRAANHQPLTPLDLFERTVEVFPDRPAIIWQDRSWTYREFAGLVARFAAFLLDRGVKPGDVVSIISPNRPEMLAAHYAVPMVGAILNTINIRLDADTIRYILDHAQSVLLILDPACAAPAQVTERVPTFVLGSPDAGANSLDLLTDAPVTQAIDHRRYITDEWQPICLNYTSGTTGRPKGVIYHHRGAYLNALGNVVALGLTQRSVYLWTLPMFHCNGWCHPWAVTSAGGLHVCLDRVEPDLIFAAIERQHVTHFSCAPVVLYMLLNETSRAAANPSRRITVATGGAAPTTALIEGMDRLGFDLIHLYGLTESYGPATLCGLSDEMAASDAGAKAAYLSRQGLRHVTAGPVRIVDDEDKDVAADSATMGEILLSGNTIMAGYYRDAEATERAFAGGWFHTGDLAVRHPDGAIQIKDRAKDIIISGGENISSLEVENILHRHHAVLLAAVVAAPDAKWGEVPCAFIELKAGQQTNADDLTAFCRERLAAFKIPKRFVFGTLPKTATGKIQKFVLRDEVRGT
jgi:fatty-acyl-CoA synthase